MGKKRSHRKGNSGGHDTFAEFLGLTTFLVAYLSIMLIFESTIDAIPLFHILMTLGGQLSYVQTVFGTTILFLIGGILLIVSD